MTRGASQVLLSSSIVAQLHGLSIDEWPLDAVGMEAVFATFVGQRVVSLEFGEDSVVDDALLEVLVRGATGSLRFVAFDNCRRASPEALASLRVLNLASLDLHYGALNEDMLLELLACIEEPVAWEALDVSHDRLTDRAADALAACTNLGTLDHLVLEGNDFSEDGLRTLREFGERHGVTVAL